jgi:hypothetical protein
LVSTREPSFVNGVTRAGITPRSVRDGEVVMTLTSLKIVSRHGGDGTPRHDKNQRKFRIPIYADDDELR